MPFSRPIKSFIEDGARTQKNGPPAKATHPEVGRQKSLPTDQTGGAGSVVVSFGADGRFYAKAQPPGNQHYRSAIRFHSGVAAVFHSHPSSCDPRPSLQDRRLADRLQVPIGTLTRQGLFVYDPTTRNTTKLMRRLEWLDEAHWDVLRSKAPANFADGQ